MPWEDVVLNDGNKIPSIAFGTSSAGHGQQAIDQIEQAISLGFSHVDTAQWYRTEVEVGKAFRECGLAREEIYITTKYSGLHDLDIQTSFQNSLENLGVSYIDSYLIHDPKNAVPDIPTAWRQFEDFKEKGLAKSIGISNFAVPELQKLLSIAKIKPAVNQILFHPYVYAEQAPTVALCQAEGIVVEAFSSLIPITHYSGGPVDILANKIAEAKSIAPEQVLLAWVKAKGVIPVTTSSKKDRLERYLDVGDIELTEAEVAAIDAAGAAGAPISPKKLAVRKLRNAVLLAFLFLVIYLSGNLVGGNFCSGTWRSQGGEHSK